MGPEKRAGTGRPLVAKESFATRREGRNTGKKDSRSAPLNLHPHSHQGPGIGAEYVSLCLVPSSFIYEHFLDFYGEPCLVSKQGLRRYKALSPPWKYLEERWINSAWQWARGEP